MCGQSGPFHRINRGHLFSIKDQNGLKRRNLGSREHHEGEGASRSPPAEEQQKASEENKKKIAQPQL